jgi:hydrogenase maturation protease
MNKKVETMKYILGFGTATMGDDAIGIIVADEIEKKIQSSDFEAIAIGNNVIRLFDYLTEKTEKIVIVDCVFMGLEPGEFKIFSPDDVITEKVSGNFSSHEGDVLKCISLARELDMPMPDIKILGIEPYEVSEKCALSETLAKNLELYVCEAVKSIL